MIARQSGLRPFIVYNQLPDGCEAVEVLDGSAEPYIHLGEFVIIDPEEREPAEGELFVITWKSDIQQRRQIVRMDLRQGRYGKSDDPLTYEEGFMWFIGRVAAEQAMSLSGHPVGEPTRWMDGPYDDGYCREICHGKIVGILEPDFRRQLNLAGEA
jgi:hypothetical protein